MRRGVLNYAQVYSRRGSSEVRVCESSRGSSRSPIEYDCSAKWPPDALLTVDSSFFFFFEFFFFS